MKLNLVLLRYFIKSFPAIIFITLVLFVTSCRKESSTSAQYSIPSNVKLISSGYAYGAATKVEIYAAADLYVGYNKLYIALYDSASNSRITQAQVSINTVLATGTIGPVENPTGTNADNGLFEAASVFVSAGSWTLTTYVQNANKNGSYIATESVAQPSPAKSYSVVTADSSSLFISYVQPSNPQLGVNNFEVVVDRQINAVSYAPDSTYMVSINPTMPSMAGMNSPNNVNPSYTGNGHYAGKVDFIMSGGWQVYVDLQHNGTVSDTSHYFAFNL